VPEATILGVLHFPALREMVAADVGLGCCVERQACAAARGGGCGANVGRTWGDAYGYALVATGRAEVMVDPVVRVWDVAAMRPVIEEAGGVFTNWDGVPSHTSGHAIATNAVLAGVARATLTNESV
jgi:histidinol-phosphatase